MSQFLDFVGDYLRLLEISKLGPVLFVIVVHYRFVGVVTFTPPFFIFLRIDPYFYFYFFCSRSWIFFVSFVLVLVHGSLL